MSDPDTSGDAGSADTSTTTTQTTNSTVDGKVMTQSQIDAIVGRAEKRASKDAEAAIIEKLGMDIDAVTKALADAKAAEESRMSESERLQRKLAEAEAERTRVEHEAREALSQARITAALAAHMDMKAIRRIAPTIHVDPNASDDELERIVEDLREEVPGLFTTTANGSAPPGTTTQNRNRPASRTTSTSSADASKQWVDKWMESNDQGGGLPLLGQ